MRAMNINVNVYSVTNLYTNFVVIVGTAVGNDTHCGRKGL